MDPGSKPRPTATCGNPPPCAAQAGALIWMDAGCVPTMAGHGYLTNHSAGPATITVAGPCSMSAAGFGYPETNGHPPGFVGGAVTRILAGLRCPRKPSAGAIALGIARSRRASASLLDGLISWPSLIFPTRFVTTACPLHKTTSFGSGPPISPIFAAMSATCLSVAPAIKTSAIRWAGQPRTIS